LRQYEFKPRLGLSLSLSMMSIMTTEALDGLSAGLAIGLGDALA
jgi:hypothetical protein